MTIKKKMSELNRITTEDYRLIKKLPVIVVLDTVRSSHNIGSVFRTADAFLMQSIYLCGMTAKPPHRDIQKTALGATESVEWKYFSNTLDAVKDLKEKGYQMRSTARVVFDHPQPGRTLEAMPDRDEFFEANKQKFLDKWGRLP